MIGDIHKTPLVRGSILIPHGIIRDVKKHKSGWKWPKEKLIPAHYRFWAKVKKTETCWIWQGAGAPHYGRFNDGVKLAMAHKYAWLEAGNEIPEGLFLLHSCDNPPCVNPAHLRVGTQLENLKDALLRGRQTRAKLLPDDVRAIRVRLANGDKTRDIAADYGMTMRPIQYIKANQHWAWLQ